MLRAPSLSMNRTYDTNHMWHVSKGSPSTMNTRRLLVAVPDPPAIVLPLLPPQGMPTTPSSTLVLPRSIVVSLDSHIDGWSIKAQAGFLFQLPHVHFTRSFWTVTCIVLGHRKPTRGSEPDKELWY
ncbi:hypothetical protein CGRA01v4_02735 [Colletotrichum graminicola]|nr:hypothetical protein CGRA01v4_02735 [Colletotrichum graminicola]